jgi:hypothetical protein
LNTRQLLVYLISAAAGILPAELVYLIMASNAGDFWIMPVIYALIIGISLSSATGVVLAHNLKVDQMRTVMRADDAMRSVGQHLAKIGYLVAVDDRDLKVTVDQNRTVRILVRPSSMGSEVSVYPGLTRVGIESMFSFTAILPFCGIIALVMTLRSYRKSLDLSHNVLRPTLSYLETQEHRDEGTEHADPGSVVVETLQQADRLAVDAFVARYASYEDSTWLIVLLGIIAYALMFVFTVSWHLVGDNYSDYSVVFLVTFPLTVASIFVLVMWNKKRYLIQSNELNERIGYLEAAIAREAGTAPTVDGAESGLETLLNICPEMPKWTRYRTRNFAYRNPTMSIVIGWTIYVITIFSGALFFIGLGFPFLVILVGTSVILYLTTKYRNIQSDRRKLRQWRSKLETMKTDMESKLQGL